MRGKEKLGKLDDSFLQNIAGGGSGPISNENTENERLSAAPSSQGLSKGAKLGIGIGTVWLASGVGCAIAASIYKKKCDWDNFYKCGTAAFNILNAPLLPFESPLILVAPLTGLPTEAIKETVFTNPLANFFGMEIPGHERRW